MSNEQDECYNSLTNSFQMLKFDELKLKLDDDVFENLHCQYRGEGNENLVLYLPKIKLVLRLRKNHANDDINPSWEKEKLKISLLYYCILLKPFFPERYLTLPVIAEISETCVKHLDEKLFPERPGHRKDKRILFGGIEIHPDYTFLSLYAQYQRLTNCPLLNQDIHSDSLRKAFSPEYLNFRNYVHSLLTNPALVSNLNSAEKNPDKITFSIEIKPKQAWTAEPYRRFDVCAFCMNQYFKLHEHKIESKSQYCPLDLFSGIEDRMKKALEGLLLTPQNNLKIFKNGELIYGEKISNNIDHILTDWFFKSQDNGDINWCKDHFCKLLIAILKNDFVCDQELASFKTEPYFVSNEYKICSNEEAELIKKAFNDSNLKCDPNFTALPENCILNRIMELQKLDEVGLEAVFDFYETRMANKSNEFSHIDDLISRVKFQSGDVKVPILNVVEAYSLSTAAKDLSIIIAIQNIPSDSQSASEFMVEVDGLKYEVTVSVVDVGPKPISCIKKHWKRDKKILASCLNYFYPVLNL